MIQIVTQRELQICARLDFCYLCGKPFEKAEQPNRDHVPPKAIFLEADRGDPLILLTHPSCNDAESGEDELVAQLVSAHHGRLPRPERQRLAITAGRLQDDATPIAFTTNINLDRIVWRWVRGFHAALYHVHLPRTNPSFVHTPFPKGRRNGEKIMFNDILDQQSFVPEVIKKNRLARNLDRIECCNGKCVYECVFVRADNGDPICFWALRIYDWEKLADSRWPRSHGCVGAYDPPGGIPSNASVGTKLSFQFPNRDTLSPFE